MTFQPNSIKKYSDSLEIRFVYKNDNDFRLGRFLFVLSDICDFCRQICSATSGNKTSYPKYRTNVIISILCINAGSCVLEVFLYLNSFQIKTRNKFKRNTEKMASSQAKCSVTWDYHANNFSDSFRDLLEQNELTDVKLAADGHLFSAHRLVLSAFSPYFRRMFTEMPVQQQAIVFMNDISKQTVEDLMTFIYNGEVNVKQDNLQDFFSAANALQIKGLADGYNQFHSQTRQSSSIGSQYQSTQTAHFTGPFTATKINVASTPVHLNKSSTKYENQDEDKSNFGGSSFDEDSVLMDGNLDDDFEYDNGTKEPVIDHKFNVFAKKWNNDTETGSSKAQMDTVAPKAKRIKRNKDLSDYSIVANIRLNAEGKENLFHNSFKFGKHNKKDCPLTRWTCTKHSNNKCRAVMSTAVINGVRMMKVVKAEHTHQPD